MGCTALRPAVDLGVLVAAFQVQVMFGRMANIASTLQTSITVSHGAMQQGWESTLTWRTRSRVRPSMPPRILRASHHLQAGPTQDPKSSATAVTMRSSAAVRQGCLRHVSSFACHKCCWF